MADLLVVVFPVVQFDLGLQPIVEEAIFRAHGANHLFINGSPDFFIYVLSPIASRRQS
jgi:hypothetical protein